MVYLSHDGPCQPHTWFTDDPEQRPPSDYVYFPLASSTAAAAASSAVGPPLMCDMKLTLERVSEHFYRIGGPLEDPFQAQATQDKGPPAPLNPSLEQGATKVRGYPLMSGGDSADSSMRRQHENIHESQHTRTAAEVAAAAATSGETVAAIHPGPHALGAAASAAAGTPDGATHQEAELCIICCNTVRRLYT